MGKFGFYYPNEKNNMQETMRARGILYVPTQIIWVLRGTNRKLLYNMLDFRKFYHSLSVFPTAQITIITIGIINFETIYFLKIMYHIHIKMI